MTALSIPERAREIAERWNGRTTLLNTLIECVTEAMRSERELCVQEAANYPWGDEQTKRNIVELLREGGQK